MSEITKEEIEVIIAMINTEQMDGSSLTINGVKLNDLKRKLKAELDNKYIVLSNKYNK